MKYLMLFLFMFPQSIYAMDVIINKVIDGDTFQIIIKEHPPELQKLSIRILHLDTPEIHGHCDLEKERAQKAKQFLDKLLPVNSLVTLKNIKYDKYGGRILADVFYNNTNIADLMKSNKLGADYEGEGPKPSWCDENFLK